MVIGSEGGNDFASQTIAFAQGIETQLFSWMEPDMKQNRDSEYFIGIYYSPNGGVPNCFSKQIPIKDLYKHIFIDQTYSLPLYKLVYNDSVITTYHWDWSTLKIKDEVEIRMLNEILYKTDFKILSQDIFVQMSKFGDDLKVVANFSNKDFKYDSDIVKAKSLIIYDGENKILYTPKK